MVDFVLPLAQSYPEPYTTFPSRWARNPPEGDRFMAFALDWSTMGLPNHNIRINVASTAPQVLSQIASVSVDNSRCAANVILVFMDSNQTITVPAYGELTATVYSGSTEFYVYAPDVDVTDRTSLLVHNSVPPPGFIYQPSIFHEVSAPGVPWLLNVAMPVTYTLIPATVSGTLTHLNIAVSGDGPSSQQMIIFDGNLPIARGFGNGNWFAAAGGVFSQVAFSIDDVSARFDNGLFVLINGVAPVNGIMSATAYYRLP